MEGKPLMNVTSNMAGSLAPESIVYIITIVLCVIFNAIVLVIIRQQKELQYQMGVLYKIMAASDLTFGISWSTWHLLFFTVESKEACEVISLIFSFVYQVSNSIAMASRCGISLNLYILITKPLRYYTVVTGQRFSLTVVFTILVIVLFCGIYFPIPYSAFMNLLVDRCFNKDLSAKSNWPSAIHTFYQIFPACATLVFTSIINVQLLLIVRQKTKAVTCKETTVHVVNDSRVDRQNSNISGEGHAKAQNRPIRLDRPRSRRFKGYLTVTIMSVTFCALWTPHVIYYAMDIDQYYVVVLDKFSASNTWVQPILYLVTNSEARRLCWKFCKGIRCCRAEENIEM